MNPGDRIRDYILEKPLGKGGMGEVWKARHELLEELVVLKGILPDWAERQGDAAFKRFCHEARTQASLRHPNIVRVREFFQERGEFFLVMDWVEGEDIYARMRKSGGRLAAEEALLVAKQMLDALDHAHRKGVIHRDLKPENILLDREGRAYLTDFGIALRAGQVAGSESRVSRGAAIGTSWYMSPEQILTPVKVTHLADVYGFGCVLFEMLCGRPPFVADEKAGETDEVVKVKHCTQAPPRPSSLNPALPQWLDGVILKALDKEPEKRFRGCGEFAKALEGKGKASPDKEKGDPSDPPSPTPPLPPAPPSLAGSRPPTVAEKPTNKRSSGIRQGLAAALILGFTLILAGLFAGWFFLRQSYPKLAVLYSDKAGIEDLKSEFSSRELPFSIVQIEEKDAKGFFSRHAERQLFFLKKSMDDANALAEAMDIPSRKPMPKEFATKHPDISLLLVEGTETPPHPRDVGTPDDPDSATPPTVEEGTGEEGAPAPGETATDSRYPPEPPPAETPREGRRRELREKEETKRQEEAKKADGKREEPKRKPRVVVYSDIHGAGIPALEKICDRFDKYVPQPIRECPPIFAGKQGRWLFFKEDFQSQAREVVESLGLSAGRCKAMKSEEVSAVPSYDIVIIENSKEAVGDGSKLGSQVVTEETPPDPPKDQKKGGKKPVGE